MRLIDADALKELFREVIGHIAKKPEMNGNLEHMIRASAMVIQMIDELPSAEPDTTTHDSNVVKKGINDGDRTSGDCISRQQAINKIKPWLEVKGYSWGELNMLRAVINELENMPSAQPEQRWIPVSESMPDEHEWIGTKHFGTTISDEVYVTFEGPDGQRFAEHISFQNGKLSRLDAEIMREWHKGAKPIAWMPLPEPARLEHD